MIEGCMFYIFVCSMSHKSRSLKIVGPGKESLTSTLGSQQLDGLIDHVAAPGSSFISFTTLSVRTPVTLIAEFPWVVTPGISSGIIYSLE